VSEVVESRHMPRIVPPIGITVPVRGTATARAMLPYMTEERQSQLLGTPPDPVLLDVFARTRMRGYSVSEGEITSGTTRIAAPILDVDGRPAAAIVVLAPSKRMPASNQKRIGAIVSRAARSLSQEAPRLA
jgi:DNA-binding IclR family transcriptional regulator